MMIAVVAFMFAFSSCSDDSDKEVPLQKLAETTWEGTLIKTNEGVQIHQFAVTMNFIDDTRASYSYAGGGSEFSYNFSDDDFNISECKYSNINGRWTIKKFTTKNIEIVKTDGNVFQRFTLKRVTTKKKD